MNIPKGKMKSRRRGGDRDGRGGDERPSAKLDNTNLLDFSLWIAVRL